MIKISAPSIQRDVCDGMVLSMGWGKFFWLI